VRSDLPARFGGPALLTATGAALLAWTWKAWPDVVSDSGRELYLPWRLSQGDVLYRDVAHFNGPLSQYANALWFRLVGVSFTHLVVADLLVLCVLCALVWRGGVALADRLTATAAGLVLLCVFAFGPLTPGGSFSYLAPYSHEMTHGLLLLLLIPFLLAWDASLPRRAGPPLATGLVLGLILLTKPELGVAGVACAAVGLVAMRAARGRTAAALALLALGAAIPPLLAWALLATAMPAQAALQGTLGAWLHLGKPALLEMPYFRIFLGTYRPVASVLDLLLWSAGWAVAFAALAALARWAGPRGRGAALVATTVAAVPGALLVVAGGSVPWLAAMRPLPLFLAALLAVDAWRLVKTRELEPARTQRVLRLSVGVLALALLLKMILFARVWHYGFVLGMPGTLLLVAALLHWIPRKLAARAPQIFRVGAASLLGAMLLGHLALAAETRRGKTVRMGRGADALWTDAERGPAMAQALAQLEALPSDATLAVLPDGVMLNYLARRRNSTPYVIGNPADMAMFGEGPMFAAYADAPPDAIALVHCDTAIYGFRYFGQDYGQALARWIERNYVRQARIGAEPFRGEGFGIVLMRRRASAPEGP
jgi:hypothetical protein